MMAVDRDFGVLFRGRLHEIGVAALHERTGHLAVRAAQHADDRAFAPAAVILAFAHLDQHAVAVPRAAVCAGRDEQIVRLGAVLGRVGGDESKGAFGGEERARHAAVMRRDRKAVFFVFHHLTVGDQAVKCALELVFSGFGQGAAHFIHAHGLCQQGKQFVFQLGLLHAKPSFMFSVYHHRARIKRKIGVSSGLTARGRHGTLKVFQHPPERGESK